MVYSTVKTKKRAIDDDVLVRADEMLGKPNKSPRYVKGHDWEVVNKYLSSNSLFCH